MLAHLARRAQSAAPSLAAAALRPLAALPTAASLVRTSSTGTAAPSPRRLADILRLDLLADKSGAEVEAIWREFHDATATDTSNAASGAHRFRLGASLPSADYAAFAARAAASPLFVLPIAKDRPRGPGEDGGGGGGGGDQQKPRPRGLLTLVTQAQAPHVLIGTLEEYRAAPGGAPAHAVVTHYDELADDKGVVLVRTDIVSPHVLSPAEAAGAVETLHRLYLDDGGHALVRAFNHAPDTFEWEALLSYLGLTGVGE